LVYGNVVWFIGILLPRKIGGMFDFILKPAEKAEMTLVLEIYASSDT